MKRKIKYLFFTVLFLSLTSCIEDQDFDQFDDLSIIPIVESSLIYVESPELIINLASGGNFFVSDFNFDAFSEPYFAERVIEGSISYQLENTTSKDLDIVLEFVDEGGIVLDSEVFSSLSEPAPMIEREVFYGAGNKDLNIIINTSTIRVSVTNLGDNTSVSSLPSPKFILKSSGQFSLRVK